MDELKLYQMDVEQTFHDDYHNVKQYYIYAQFEEEAEATASGILSMVKDRMKLKSMEIKSIKEVKPKAGCLLGRIFGGMD